MRIWITKQPSGPDDAYWARFIDFAAGFVCTRDAATDTVTVEVAGGAHGHTIGDVAGLQTELDAKAPTSHAHSYNDLTDKPTLGDAAAKNVGTGADDVSAGNHTHPGGSEAFPVGSVFIAVVSTNPGTLLGYGTWVAFGAGRVLVGLDAADTDFDTAEEVGGAKTVASTGSVSQPTFTGTPFSGVINHTHPVNITDPTHNHTQNAHNHVITSQTATTGGATSYEHGTLDTSSAEAEATEVTANATATNIAASTGITATTSNPAGGVASITPAGSVSQPTYTGNATSVVQPYIVVYMWKRTA